MILLFSSRTSRSTLQNVNLILLGASRMPLMPSLFIKAVKDICTINTFEKLLNIWFSEVNCLHFDFTTRLSIFCNYKWYVNIYIISSVMHAFLLVLTYDLLEDRKTFFNSLLYKTNGFQVAMRLFSNRSQRTSKCGKNISDTLGCASCATFFFLPLTTPIWVFFSFPTRR